MLSFKPAFSLSSLTFIKRLLGVSLVAQVLKHLPAMQGTQIQSLGREDPLEKEWQPTPVFLPGEFHGQRSLAGYSPWSHRELDTTEQITQKRLFSSFSLSTVKAVSSAYLRLLTFFLVLLVKTVDSKAMEGKLS